MPKLIIHAGFPKSGTTALQAALRHNTDLLASAGVTYPISKKDAHHNSVAALVGRSVGWASNKRDLGIWDEFVSSIKHNNSEITLISSEFFTAAGKEQIKKIKKDFKNYEFEIIFTIRELEKIIPSFYQQSLKKGSTLTYPQWISEKFLTPSGELRSIPKIINHASVLARWASIFGDENITLVIGDSHNPDALFTNFESAIQIPKLIPIETRGLNRSLTVRECEILRRVNLKVIDSWSWYEYKKIVRDNFVKSLTGTLATSYEGTFQVPQFISPVIRDFAENQVIQIKRSRIKVIGELDVFCAKNRSIVETTQIDENSINRDVKIIMGHLNWIRQKHRFHPLNLVRKIKSFVLR